MDLNEHIRLAGIIRGLADKLSGEDYARIWDEVMALDVDDDEGDDSLSLDDGLPTISDSRSLEVARRKLEGRLETAMMDASTRSLFLRSLDSALDVTLDNDGCRILSKRLGAVWRLLGLSCPSFRLDDVEKARVAMDVSHEGLGRLKDFLLDELAASALDGTTPHPVLLVGPPGCGKTSLSVSLASALCDHGHSIIPMAGKSAAFELAGNDQGWSRAGYGSIVSAFLKASSLSPVVIFDELDKVGSEDRYSRADSVFMDLLQPERAASFTDAFLTLPFDASHAWYIFTANKLDGIPEPLLDRLTIFQMERYDFESMMGIAKRIIDEMNEDALCPLRFSQAAQRTLVYGCYGMSTSVRPLRQAVEGIFASKAQLQLAKRKGEIRINETDVKKILSRDRLPSLVEDFLYSPGVVSGIGVADGRGYILPVEARNVHSPLHEVKVTGLVEQVMLESANIAYDLAASYAEKYLGKELEAVTVNYTYSFCKRGDSASLATALAILSDLTGVMIPKTIAITGAVSLKGNILPIGSVIAKITGVAEQGAEMVVLPEGNRKDVESVPSSMLPAIKLRYVSTFREVVESLLPPLKNYGKERLGA